MKEFTILVLVNSFMSVKRVFYELYIFGCGMPVCGMPVGSQVIFNTSFSDVKTMLDRSGSTRP